MVENTVFWNKKASSQNAVKWKIWKEEKDSCTRWWSSERRRDGAYNCACADMVLSGHSTFCRFDL